MIEKGHPMIANPTLFIGKKLVDQYNNFYHCSIDTKPINAGYSALNEKIETNLKVPKFKVNWVRITKHKNIFSKGYIEKTGQEKYLLLTLL